VHAGDVELLGINVHERGGAQPVGAGPALVKGTTDVTVERAGEADRASAAKPEALVPRTKDDSEVVRGHEMAPQEMPTEGERGSARLLQNTLLKDGGRKPKALPSKSKHMPEALRVSDRAGTDLTRRHERTGQRGGPEESRLERRSSRQMGLLRPWT
jgi:hypothetical protein